MEGWGKILREVRIGDAVEKVLSGISITPERVEEWVGKPCGCRERKWKLNQLGAWMKRLVSGKTEKAEEYLVSIMEGEEAQAYTKKMDELRKGKQL